MYVAWVRALLVRLIVVAAAVPEATCVVQVLLVKSLTESPETTPETVIVGVVSVPGVVDGDWSARPEGAVGAVVSMTIALFVASVVAGTKLVRVLLAVSLIVPVIEFVVRSLLVSPAWTV